MNTTPYKFDELMDMRTNSPKKFMYIYYAMSNLHEQMNKGIK